MLITRLSTERRTELLYSYTVALRGLGWTVWNISEYHFASIGAVHGPLSLHLVFDDRGGVQLTVDERTEPHNHPIRVRDYRGPDDVAATLDSPSVLQATDLCRRVKQEMRGCNHEDRLR